MVFGGSTPVLSPLFCKNLDNFIVCGVKYLAIRFFDMWGDSFDQAMILTILRGLEQKVPKSS